MNFGLALPHLTVKSLNLICVGDALDKKPSPCEANPPPCEVNTSHLFKGGSFPLLKLIVFHLIPSPQRQQPCRHAVARPGVIQ